MPKISAIFLGAAAVAWTAWTHAAAEPVAPSDEPPNFEAKPEAPELPPPVQSGESLEPEVTIRRDAEKTMTEYRVNGRIHSIKVEPAVGPTYWLVDTTGDGFANARFDNYNPPFLIPGWVIFRW